MSPANAFFTGLPPANQGGGMDKDEFLAIKDRYIAAKQQYYGG